MLDRLLTFKVDENLPHEVVDLLRGAGHDAITVGEQGLSGTGDPRLAETIRIEERTLVTLDVDFADIRTYPPGRYSGLIVLRLERQDKPHVLRVLERIAPLLGVEPVKQRLWVVDAHTVRVRGEDA